MPYNFAGSDQPVTCLGLISLSFSRINKIMAMANELFAELSSFEQETLSGGTGLVVLGLVVPPTPVYFLPAIHIPVTVSRLPVTVCLGWTFPVGMVIAGTPWLQGEHLLRARRA